MIMYIEFLSFLLLTIKQMYNERDPSMKQIVKISQYEINISLSYYKFAAMWGWTYK